MAVPVPLRQSFTYRWAGADPAPPPGCRVEVPFAARRLVGVVLPPEPGPAPPAARLKPVHRVIDDAPVLREADLELLLWCSAYYHAPVGEVMAMGLPALLRRGEAAREPSPVLRYAITPAGRAALRAGAPHRAPLRKRLLERLQSAGTAGMDRARLAAVSDGWRPAVAALCAQGWVAAREESHRGTTVCGEGRAVTLSAAQEQATRAVLAGAGRYRCFLLHGVTGSGKTEVYLRIVQSVIATGAQALILVPEIALTPQLIERIETRLAAELAVLHSGLTEAQRYRSWWRAQSGRAPVVLGTRSAVFTPLPRLGVVVVDEEHDTSYKQQDGCRYHARDVAIKRASVAGVPIVLGSATPALETEVKARSEAYTRLRLPSRSGSGTLPSMELVPMDSSALHDGLTPRVLAAIEARLARGEQSLVFINRRGYSPILACFRCGWRARCRHCDAHLTWHRTAGRLRCHHCGAAERDVRACPRCGNERLVGGGEGTQRVAESLQARFPDAGLVRIDRDSAGRPGAFARLRHAVTQRQALLLVGTQMLAKGHDFPDVTLVCVLNADQGLFSLDFRAPEYLFQQIVQVAGRAGRGERPGKVLIQTRYPDHPCFRSICRHDYDGFADAALPERREAGYPPYAYVALVRAESRAPEKPLAFLARARQQGARVLESCRIAGVSLMYPVPAAMERRAGWYRAQLMVQASRRPPLHAFLGPWIATMAAGCDTRGVRWSVDVDPTDMS